MSVEQHNLLLQLSYIILLDNLYPADVKPLNYYKNRLYEEFNLEVSIDSIETSLILIEENQLERQSKFD